MYLKLSPCPRTVGDLHRWVNGNGCFQVFGIAIEITAAQLTQPFPLCLVNQGSMDATTSARSTNLECVLLFLIKDFGEFIGIVQNQYFVLVKKR